MFLIDENGKECVKTLEKEYLVCKNIPLIYFITKKYYPKYLFDEDIVSIGMLALVKAAKKRRIKNDF